MRSRDNTTIATWNVVTLSQLVYLKNELMKRKITSGASLYYARWANGGKVQTDEGHKFYYILEMITDMQMVQSSWSITTLRAPC